MSRLEHLLFFRQISPMEYEAHNYVERMSLNVRPEHYQSLIDLGRQCEKDSSLFGNLCYAMRIDPEIMMMWIKVRKMLES